MSANKFEGMLLKNMEAKMRREQVAYRIYCKRHRFMSNPSRWTGFAQS